MATSTAMTIRIAPEVKDRLRRLAEQTRRSKSYLAAEAVTAFVDREIEIVDGIVRGLTDVEAGRTVSHDDAMSVIDSIIQTAEQARKA